MQLKIANLQVDLLARKAWRGGVRIDLTAKEFALLAVLARRQGEILSKTAIAELVWDMNFDSNTNVVEVAIKRLRAKIDGAFTPKLLHTIRGMGYVMEVRDPRNAAPMKLSITARLVAMFAVATLATFARSARRSTSCSSTSWCATRTRSCSPSCRTCAIRSSAPARSSAGAACRPRWTR